MSMYVCLSLCGFICLLPVRDIYEIAHPKFTKISVHVIAYGHGLVFSNPLAVLRYVMYFRFSGLRHIFPQCADSQ